MLDKKMNSRDLLTNVINDYIETNDDKGAEILSHAFDVDAQWDDLIDERQTNEVLLARVYAADFAHGTTGHNQLMLIAKMSECLDVYEDALHRLIDYIDNGRTG